MRLPEVHDNVLDRVQLEALHDAVMMRAKPGTPYPGGANRGGWKSDVNLFSWTPDPIIPEVRGVLERLVGRGYALGNAWAVVNRNGSWHGRHRHGVTLMGLLFVASGDPMVPTVFEHGSGPGVSIVDPIPGRVVLCGDLYHYVNRYDGHTPRITIAFDGKLA